MCRLQMRRLLARQAVRAVCDEGRRVHGATVTAFVKEYTKLFDQECLRRQLESNAVDVQLCELYNLSVGVGLEPSVAHVRGFSSVEQQQASYKAKLLAMSVDDEDDVAHGAVAQLIECGSDIATPGKDGITPLHVASRNGALRNVCLLLDHGADAAALTQHGVSTLFVAAQNGHADVVEVLAQRGVAVDGVNGLGETPMHAAAKNGHAAVVALLVRLKPTSDINVRTHCGWTPLHCAASHRSSDVVRLLIEHSGDINAVTKDGMTPLHVAAVCGRENFYDFDDDEGLKHDNQLCELLMGDNINARAHDGATPLLTAAKHERQHTVASLLKLGAMIDIPNARGETPMHAAASACCTSCIRLLAQNGANVNVVNELGETPLHAAATNDCYGFAGEALMAAGAAVNARSHNGMTPLHFAAQGGHKASVEGLVKLGADIEAVSTNGETPLFVAAAHGREECIAILAGRWAVKSVVDVPAKGCVTPLLIAVENNHLEAVRKLLDCDANLRARADDGRTPLSAASLCAPDGDVVRCLRDRAMSGHLYSHRGGVYVGLHCPY